MTPRCNAAPSRRRAPRLHADEALVVDAGFGVAALLTAGVPALSRGSPAILRPGAMSCPPTKAGDGARSMGSWSVRCPGPTKGRPLPPRHPMPPPSGWWPGGRSRRRCGTTWCCPRPSRAAPAFRCVVIHDPRYKEPLVLATTLPVSAEALWRLYRDRWPIEQVPLAAKQMLGAHRAFVFGEREPPSPARVGALGRQCLGVCGRHDGGGGHGLLGSVLPSDLWALASAAAAGAFFRNPRAGRDIAEKGVGDGAFAQGCPGASASARCHHTPANSLRQQKAA